MQRFVLSFIMTVQNPQFSKTVFMSNFYLHNLLNSVLFEARPLSEHLPYEEGIIPPQSHCLNLPFTHIPHHDTIT